MLPQYKSVYRAARLCLHVRLCGYTKYFSYVPSYLVHLVQVPPYFLYSTALRRLGGCVGGQTTNLYKSNYCSYYECSVHHNYHRLGVTTHLVTELFYEIL